MRKARLKPRPFFGENSSSAEPRVQETAGTAAGAAAVAHNASGSEDFIPDTKLIKLILFPTHPSPAWLPSAAAAPASRKPDEARLREPQARRA